MMRVFVGLSVAPAIAQDLTRLVRAQSAWIETMDPADFHITLVPPWDEPSVEEAIDRLRSVAGRFAPFSVTFQRVAFGPQQERPRLLWAECASSVEITAFRSAVLATFGMDDDRPFRPHATLARIRGRAAARARQRTLDLGIHLTQAVTSVELFRSPPEGGAGYQVVASAELRGRL
jgi:2'-5' RNA ligase